MKKDFFDILYKEMAKNKDINIIFVDLGWPRVDEFIKAYPDRAFTTGAAEQTALDIAVGLAYEGKIPFVYTITPFLFRGFETIRNYIDHENLNVKMMGAGRGDDYSKTMGFSHDAQDAKKIFNIFKNVVQVYPKDKKELLDVVKETLIIKRPYFISLTR